MKKIIKLISVLSFCFVTLFTSCEQPPVNSYKLMGQELYTHCYGYYTDDFSNKLIIQPNRIIINNEVFTFDEFSHYSALWSENNSADYILQPYKNGQQIISIWMNLDSKTVIEVCTSSSISEYFRAKLVANTEAEFQRLAQEEKEARYSAYVGTTWKITEGEEEYTNIYTLAFADDRVTLGNNEYSFNKKTDIFLNYEFSNAEKFSSSLKCIFKVGNVYYGLCEPFKWYGNTYMNFYDGTTAHYPEFSLKSSGGAGAGGSDLENVSDVNGTYKFTGATGSQNNGNITLENGNWKYSGDRSRNPNSGTYSVSGNELTMKWTANGYDVSEIFVLSGNGNSVTWRSQNDFISNLFSMLFGIANSLEVTFVKEM